MRSEKMIGVGEGGFVATNDKKLFDKANTPQKTQNLELQRPLLEKYYADDDFEIINFLIF